jgi:U3 small nucleolar RNA-associated protein 19
MAPRSSLPPSHKKRKHSDHNDYEKAALKIVQLEKQITEAVASKSSLNPLVDLLDIAHNTVDAQTASKGIWALYRVFVVIMTHDLLLNVSGSDESQAVRVWLQEKLNAYVTLLVGLMKDEEPALKVRC